MKQLGDGSQGDDVPAVLGRGQGTQALVASHDAIIQVMKEVMTEEVHYGTIPGTQKPSLWKAGAEVLNKTFGIAVECEIMDCDESDGEIRYRVRATASIRGEVIGSDERVASSLEKKYKWRKPVCDAEWDETDPMRRTDAWEKEQGDAVKKKKVRQEPEDIRNTLAGMASKRAYVSITLRVTGASDVFTQDLADLPEGTVVDVKGRKEERKKPERASAQAKEAAPAVAPGEGLEVESVSERMVTIRTGEDKGKEKPIYKIAAGGRKFSTFKLALADAAKAAKAAGQRIIVEASGEPNEYGEERLKGIRLAPVAAAPAPAPAPAPAEAPAAPATPAPAPSDQDGGPWVVSTLEALNGGGFMIGAGGLNWYTADPKVYDLARSAMAGSKKVRLLAGQKRTDGSFTVEELAVA